MKKRSIVASSVLLPLTLFASQAMASELLSDDSTVKHHERKALLQLSDVGIYTKRFSLPVTYCPYKAKKCLSKGVWHYTIGQSLEDDASDLLLGRLNGKRYDTLKIKKDKLAIKTIFEDIEIDSTINNFSYGIGSGSDFQNKVENYLNDNIAPVMLRLLAKAKDARYQEMPDKEKETFLATIAKEESVPVKFIQKLMNSAYTFALHLDNLSGSVKIDQEQRKDSKGKKYMVYDTSVSLNTNVNLVIFHFNPNEKRFKHYSTVKGYSGPASSSTEFNHYPKPRMTENNFANAYKLAAKASGIAANTNLKDDDNFAVFATVDELEDSDIKSRIGALEDLRIDAPYLIYQQQDGERTLMGWTKAKTVASEKTYKQDNANYTSDFHLIKGSAELMDQMREHPWTGVFWYIGAASNTITVEDINNTSASGGGSYIGLNLGGKLDMGYVFNAKGLSEKWLEFNINYGVGGDDIEVGSSTYADTSVYSIGLDVVHRTNLKSTGTYWGFKYGIGGTGISGKDTFDNELKISATALNLGLQVGMQSHPDTQYYANLDLMVPFGAKADNGAEFDATLSTSINLTVGAAFHIRSIGGLSGAMR